eukprot:scaffold3120_cov73-Cylindrotheca_fusiformis.AAC.4
MVKLASSRNQIQRKHRYKSGLQTPISCKSIYCAFAILIWVLVWVFGLNLITSFAPHHHHHLRDKLVIEEKDNSPAQRSHPAVSSNLDDNDSVAIEIPGMKVELPFKDQEKIEVIYPATIGTTTTAADPKEHPSSKGLVLLLHACTHSALKFFSPSKETCPDCVGLSEELRIVRLLIREGYTPVAITCLNRKSGCWSNADIPRVKHVLSQQPFSTYTTNTTRVVYAMGASSGGAFVAQLVVEHLVQAGLIMVMGLGPQIVTKLKALEMKPILYLAPMPRDKGTTYRASQNYNELMKDHNANVTTTIFLDTTRCKALPVTVAYLVQRVPGMTPEVASNLIQILQREQHIDASTKMLLVDPTRSNWRDLLLVAANDNNNNSSSNSTHYAGRFALKPGYSPLAKALHRAWAFHEYCSEVVVPALRFFEEHDQ